MYAYTGSEYVLVMECNVHVRVSVSSRDEWGVCLCCCFFFCSFDVLIVYLGFWV